MIAQLELSCGERKRVGKPDCFLWRVGIVENPKGDWRGELEHRLGKDREW